MKAKFLVPILFVAAYLILSTVFLTTFNGAGHGWGITAFYYLGFPSSYAAILVEDLGGSGVLILVTCLLAGIIQSAFLGYLVQRLFSASRPRKTKRM